VDVDRGQLVYPSLEDVPVETGLSRARPSRRAGESGELRGLSAAAGLPGGVRGGRELLVITLDQEDALREERLSIRVIPAWKWLD
jgi:hypothetical protein